LGSICVCLQVSSSRWLFLISKVRIRPKVYCGSVSRLVWYYRFLIDVITYRLSKCRHCFMYQCL
jgi:hypothetical protein